MLKYFSVILIVIFSLPTGVNAGGEALGDSIGLFTKTPLLKKEQATVPDGFYKNIEITGIDIINFVQNKKIETPYRHEIMFTQDKKSGVYRSVYKNKSGGIKKKNVGELIFYRWDTQPFFRKKLRDPYVITSAIASSKYKKHLLKDAFYIVQFTVLKEETDEFKWHNYELVSKDINGNWWRFKPGFSTYRSSNLSTQYDLDRYLWELLTAPSNYGTSKEQVSVKELHAKYHIEQGFKNIQTRLINARNVELNKVIEARNKKLREKERREKSKKIYQSKIDRLFPLKNGKRAFEVSCPVPNFFEAFNGPLSAKKRYIFEPGISACFNETIYLLPSEKKMSASNVSLGKITKFLEVGFFFDEVESILSCYYEATGETGNQIYTLSLDAYFAESEKAKSCKMTELMNFSVLGKNIGKKWQYEGDIEWDDSEIEYCRDQNPKQCRFYIVPKEFQY